MENFICHDCVCYWANGDTESYSRDRLSKVLGHGYFVPTFEEDIPDYSFYGVECDICEEDGSTAICEISYL